MKEYIWLLIGFMIGIMFSVYLMRICKRRNRNRGNLIVPRRRLQTVPITPHVNNADCDTDSNTDGDTGSDVSIYSITVEEETKDMAIRITEIA